VLFAVVGLIRGTLNAFTDQPLGSGASSPSRSTGASRTPAHPYAPSLRRPATTPRSSSPNGVPPTPALSACWTPPTRGAGTALPSRNRACRAQGAHRSRGPPPEPILAV